MRHFWMGLVATATMLVMNGSVEAQTLRVGVPPAVGTAVTAQPFAAVNVGARAVHYRYYRPYRYYYGYHRWRPYYYNHYHYRPHYSWYRPYGWYRPYYFRRW